MKYEDIYEAWWALDEEGQEDFLREHGSLGYNVVTEYIYRIKYLHLDTERSALEILEEIEEILR